MRTFRRDGQEGGQEATMASPPDEWAWVAEALRTEPGKCPLCGLALGARKGARLCPKCLPVAGLSREEWGWCDGRHKRATTQRQDGAWRCLACQSKRKG